MGKGQDGYDLAVLSQSLRERDEMLSSAHLWVGDGGWWTGAGLRGGLVSWGGG